ncbi:hypothetical protein AA316_002745 [Salmonella enterica subsp. enterica]|nr:hypothetical protein [Salmonella enterica subsp. enterica]EDR7284640.1 hypothetical protein [Salmonella enterica subsp. enterica]EEI3987226.1 hypothetical protein [Salmonella enterica]EEJ3663120.1 hypothetical protein [Salmonella enterica subsp. enterica]
MQVICCYLTWTIRHGRWSGHLRIQTRHTPIRPAEFDVATRHFQRLTIVECHVITPA